MPASARQASRPRRRPSGSPRSPTGLRSPVYVTSAPGRQAPVRRRAGGHDPHRQQGEGRGQGRTPTCAASSPPAASRACSRSRSIPSSRATASSTSTSRTSAGNEEIWELRARKGAASIRPGHRKLLEIADTEGNHNGGQLQFGPDGMLYFGDGDGGGGGDQHGEHGNGQNPADLLGKLGRIDVDTRTGGKPYGIPKDNPFVGQAGWAPEIWALGLRNPWRFSFDRANGDLWIGDVGQNAWEEVDHVKRGVGGINYGWNRYEGRHDFESGTPLAGGQLRGPVAEYSHVDGCSITGGYVYRGPKIAGPQRPLRLRRLLLRQDVDARDLRRRSARRLERRRAMPARSRSSPSGRTDRACCTCARPRDSSTASSRASRGGRLRRRAGAVRARRRVRAGRGRGRRHGERAARGRARPRHAHGAHGSRRRGAGDPHVRAAHARGRDARLPRAPARRGRELRGRLVPGRPADPPERRPRLGPGRRAEALRRALAHPRRARRSAA